MNDTHFMKAYTIKEVSKKINVPSGTIRQWEKDLEGLLFIPRTKQGARFYTEVEIEWLIKIKQMRDKNLSKDMIKELLQQHLAVDSRPSNEIAALPAEQTSVDVNTVESDKGYDPVKSPVEHYNMAALIDEVKSEIIMSIRKEVLDEVKKEITKGTFTTVKTISDSIYKSGEKTTEQIRKLSDTMAMSNAENTVDKIVSLSDRLAQTTKGTDERLSRIAVSVDHLSSGTNKEITMLAKRLNETKETVSEEFKILADYVSTNSETTNQELSNLNEMINQERESFLSAIKREREDFRREIIQRDELFKEMVDSFRETASAKSQRRSWWKVWK